MKVTSQSRISLTFGDKVFNAVCTSLLCLILLIVAYPLYFVVIASFSNFSLVATGRVILYPKGLTLDSYLLVFERQDIWTGYLNTFIYTVSSVIIGLVLTLTAAFGFSFTELPGRRSLMLIFVFTMFFGGGLVPTYIWINNLGLNNTPIYVILSCTFSVYNMIITITFMSSSIPHDLYEAARIDGCGYLQMFLQITLPLSKAIIAVLVIYIAVGQWNSYFTPMVYLRDEKYTTLSLVLKKLLSLSTVNTGGESENLAAKFMLAEQLKYSIIIVSSFPIMCLYPFVQKHFVKGVMIGALKG